LSEAMDRLKAMEARVAQIKDWKVLYEQDKGKWDEERERLKKEIEVFEKLREFLRGWLKVETLPVQAGKVKMNLTHNELTVNLTHEEREVNLTTGTAPGKVLFAALTDLSKEGFTELELSPVLSDHGWNVPHNTLAPTLGGMVRDGYLVRIEGTRPTKYRLPTKLKFNIEKK